ncbi:hypothetical protein HQ520_12085 [bacterium]|nr:hypothetical protein [bacterium]
MQHNRANLLLGLCHSTNLPVIAANAIVERLEALVVRQYCSTSFLLPGSGCASVCW